MGRYYQGDIEGKFWFGVQSSSDAEFFGAGENTGTIDYYAEDQELCEKGIQECIKALGDNKDKLDKFFSENDSYNDERLAKDTGIPLAKVSTLLMWYARLELGKKMLKAIEGTGSCSFSVEM